jgi:biopolymer transport protein TolR
MGMHVGNHSGGVTSEINVTPLIDVLLVLLIIFLVIMPIMVKVEPLEVPRSLDEGSVPETAPLTVTLKTDLQIVFNDGDKDTSIEAVDLAKILRPRLAAFPSAQKVVFVDFEPAVPWKAVVETMDTIRSLADDTSHDEIKVALKVGTEPPRHD